MWTQIGVQNKDYNYHYYKCNHVESATAGTLFNRVNLVFIKRFMSYLKWLIQPKKSRVLKSANVMELVNLLLGYLCTNSETPWEVQEISL